MPEMEQISNPMRRCSIYFREGTGLRVILCTSSVQVKNVEFKCLQKMKLDGNFLRNGAVSPYEFYKGSLRLNGKTISNLDIFNNNVDGEHDCPREMLLIGPNTGGKSTLLHATCLTVIMAQPGVLFVRLVLISLLLKVVRGMRL